MNNQNITPLNISSTAFCKHIGLANNGEILKQLRELNLVRFFKIGKKYMYPAEDAKKVSDLLRDHKISIKTYKGGYYITLND